MRITFLHPRLDFTDSTARLLATVRAALAAGHEISVVSDKGSRTEALLKTGAGCFVGELPTDPVLGVFAMGRARQQIAQLKPDLLHVTDGRLDALAARLSRSLERPYILELAAPPERRLRLENDWLRTVLLPCKTFVEKTVNAGQVARQCLTVIEHGPQLQYSWAPPESDPQRKPVVVMIGTLDRDHAVDVLIEAARILDSAERPLNVMVLGEGPEEQNLRRQVRELHLSHSFTIGCPVIPEVNSVLAQADLHVCCARRGNPGWSAAQALGMGIPSIFSAISSTFGWVEDRQDGLLVEPNDPQKLAQAIELLLDNSEAALQMSKRAHHRGQVAGRNLFFLAEVAALHGQ